MKLILIGLMFSAALAHAEGPWIKVQVGQKIRYFPKNTLLRICGIFEKVDGEPIDNAQLQHSAISIDSCLEEKDSIEETPTERYKILALVGANLQIADKKNVRYTVPAGKIAALWAVRFEKGEVLFNGKAPCEVMYDWRSMRREDFFKDVLPKLPPELTGPSEIVRYHAFEYNMGCGT